MMVRADEVEKGGIYRMKSLGRHDYLVRHTSTVAALVKRLESKGARRTGRDCWLLAMAKDKPGGVVMWVVTRGRGWEDDKPYEKRTTMVLQAGHGLRKVKNKPPYPSKRRRS